MINFVKKTFDKIEEFRKANAMVEEAKNRLAVLKSQINESEKIISNNNKLIIAKENELKDKNIAVLNHRKEIEKKLEVFIDESNNKLSKIKEEIKNNEEEIKSSINECKEVKNSLARLRIEEEKAKLNVKNENDLLFKARENLQKTEFEIGELEKSKNITKEQTEELRKENADIEKRKKDLDIYARRIQRYYDEQNIKIII